MWALRQRLWIKFPAGACFTYMWGQTGRIFCISEQKQHENRQNLKDFNAFINPVSVGPMWTGEEVWMPLPQTDLPALPCLWPCSPPRSPDLPNIYQHHLEPHVGAFGFSKVPNSCSMWWTGALVWMIGYIAQRCPPTLVVALQHFVCEQHEWCEGRWKVSRIICELDFLILMPHQRGFGLALKVSLSETSWQLHAPSEGDAASKRDEGRGFRFPFRQMWLMWSKHVRRVFTLQAAALTAATLLHSRWAALFPSANKI